MHLMGVAVEELDHTKNEIIGCVERIQDLVSRHRQRWLSGCAAFHFNEPEFTSLWVFAFNVVAQLFEFPIQRLETKATLDVHDDGASTRGNGEPINGLFSFGHGLSCHLCK